MIKIKNNDELRAAVALATNDLYLMCNTKDVNELLAAFTDAKDNIIEIYKYNHLRVMDRLDDK